jgi:hypothetical protein
MRILEYTNLDFKKIKKDYETTKSFLEKDDFKSADLKKLKGHPFYRAKLNYSDRILLYPVKSHDMKCFIAIEIIHNHEYEKSRFLRGAQVQEEDIITEEISDDINIMKYIHPANNRVLFLKKFISFDDDQLQIYNTYPPVMISGPAGSGKTIILLEKMKQLGGNGLYVTQSDYLVDHARQLYFSHSYVNENQDIDFFGFKQLLESIEIPRGREIEITEFKKFTALFIGTNEYAQLVKEPQKLFEEFRGVLTGSGLERPYLRKDEYTELGVKQTIYLDEDRVKVYSLFEKYLHYLNEKKCYDPNLVSWDYLQKITPKYDFVVIDEIQDLTPIQILLILKFLNRPENFIFCGDAHQIVHPNFFSWAKLKTFLFNLQEKNLLKINQQQILHVITNNFRNAKKITELSNKILMIKNLRFGSVDRESHFLLKANSENEGKVEFYQERPKLCMDLNQKTKKSIQWAIIVMNDDQKKLARIHFQTPLIFSIHEAKGLEYENVILFNLVSGFEKEFKLITENVDKTEMIELLKSGKNMEFTRQKDKEDKTLEAFKFYVNSVYVAVTRAIESVIWIEASRKHPFFDLIQAESKESETIDSLSESQSTLEEWQHEASRLAAQGKEEQANAIKKEFLKIESVPWEVMDVDNYFKHQREALQKDIFNKKAKQKCYEFAHIYRIKSLFPKLLEAKHSRAQKPDQDNKYIYNQYYGKFESNKMNDLKQAVKKYGSSFKNEMSQPVLMATTMSLNSDGVKFLLDMGADNKEIDLFGTNSLQRLLSKIDDQKEFPLNLNEFVKIYDMLSQKPITFKFRDRAVQVMPHKAEYFLINYLIGLFTYHYTTYRNYVSSKMLEDSLQNIPESILPPWRKTRKYWNSILSNNHSLKGTTKGNLFLLLRINTGIYVINPELEIEANGEWVKIYDFLRINFLDVFLTKRHFLKDVFQSLENTKKELSVEKS